MDITTRDGQVLKCDDRPMPAGLVHRASLDGTEVALKIGGADWEGAGWDAGDGSATGGGGAEGPNPYLLERLGEAGIAPELVSSGTIVAPSHLAGRQCLVQAWVGPSLADMLRTGEPLAADDIDRLAVGLLNAIEESSRFGVQPLQLSLEHVLLPLEGPPVLCGWSSAWVEEEPYAGNGGWPEQDLVPEQTAIYLWGLVMACAVLRGSPARDRTPDDRTFLAIDEESREQLGRRLDARRAQLIDRALDVNPQRRPSCDDALREWTGAVGRAPVAGVSSEEAPAPWRLRVAARVVESRGYRFGLMGAAGLVGFIVGHAVFGVSPLG